MRDGEASAPVSIHNETLTGDYTITTWQWKDPGDLVIYQMEYKVFIVCLPFFFFAAGGKQLLYFVSGNHWRTSVTIFRCSVEDY